MGMAAVVKEIDIQGIKEYFAVRKVRLLCYSRITGYNNNNILGVQEARKTIQYPKHR